MVTSFKKGFTLIELLVVIAIIGILAGIVLASLGSARSKGNDAKIKEQLAGMRNAMEIYYSTNNNYGTAATSDGCPAGAASAVPWNDTSSGMSSLSTEANYPSGTALVCYTTTPATGATWAASASLSTTGQYWCVDSTGKSASSSAQVTAPALTTTAVACP